MAARRCSGTAAAAGAGSCCAGRVPSVTATHRGVVATGAGVLEGGGEAAEPGSAERVHVPDHDASRRRRAARRATDASQCGVGGRVPRLDELEPPDGLAAQLDGAQHGQLADSGLALDGEPLARPEDPLHLLAGVQPRRAGADDARAAASGAARRAVRGRGWSGWSSTTCATMPEGWLAAADASAVHPGGQTRRTARPGRVPRRPARIASVACASSVDWSAGRQRGARMVVQHDHVAVRARTRSRSCGCRSGGTPGRARAATRSRRRAAPAGSARRSSWPGSAATTPRPCASR